MSKSTSKADRITLEMMEIALALSKHGLLSMPDLTQVKVLCKPSSIFTARNGQHQHGQGQNAPDNTRRIFECESVSISEMGIQEVGQTTKCRHSKMTSTD